MSLLTYEVSNPSDYGVLELDKDQKPISITEKPKQYISNLAVTGLYFFDHHAPTAAKAIEPSSRGELEITALIEHYMRNQELTFTSLTRGTAWLDTGNPNSLNDAADYMRIIEERTGLKIACLEEIGLGNGWLTYTEIVNRLDLNVNNSYTNYLRKLSAVVNQ